MKKKVAELVKKRIDRLYIESRELLLSRKSYDTKWVNTQSVMLYLAFLESGLKRPYNRLTALAAFLDNDGDLLLDQMYPFNHLYEDSIETIKGKAKKAESIIAGLKISDMGISCKSLCKEKYKKE